MVSCLLCLETFNNLDSIIPDSKRWQELNIAETLEKHFWPLNINQLNSCICLLCWQIVKDFHEFYTRIEQAHMIFNVIKVEKEELMETNFQETEITIDQKVPHHLTQQEIQYSGCTNTSLAENTENNKVADLADEHTSSGNIRENYESDTDTSDDDDDDGQETVMDKNKSSDVGLNFKCKNNDKFIAEHFKQMNCDLCQVPFINFTAMKKHFANEHNQRGYVVCCKRHFSDRSRFVDHLRLHLNPNHFKCNHCGKTMSDRRSIKRHILFEHLGNVDDKSHQCITCDISFKEEYLLRLHKSIHLPDEEKKFPCCDCTEIYENFYALLQHLKDAHLKKFFNACYVCGKSIISKRAFESHINKHEGIPHIMVYCDICGLGLSTENGLRRHQKSQHPVDGKKDYQCPNCPKISPNLKAIRKHINTMHVVSADYKCEICERVFKRKSILKEHMAAHEGTPLYTCPWCPKTFYSSSNMHTHRKRIHHKQWEKAKLEKYSKDFQKIISSSS